MSIDTTVTATIAEAIVPAGETNRREATVMELASVIAASRDFPECRSPEKAAVRILAGREMGLGPINSVMGIRIQNGRVSMDAGLMAGLIKRSGRYDYKAREHTAEKCVLEFLEDGQAVGVSEFSIEDAKKAGLAKKDTWAAYPRNMLFARALSNGARWYLAGIFGGAVYTHEELGYQVDDEGRAVEVAGTNGDLCTREQRQQITAAVAEAGLKIEDVMAREGVRILDELSGYEADKLLKKLAKKAAVKPATATDDPRNGPPPPSVADQVVPPENPPTSPATALMGQAFERIKPSTSQQRQRILDLAERLEPNEGDCRAMLLTIVNKRGKVRLADLNQAEADEIAAKMEARLAEPPFDPTPASGVSMASQS